jgi:hypothetical protein
VQLQQSCHQGPGKNTSLCSSGVVAGRDLGRNTRRCSSNSHAARDTGRYTRLCSSRDITGRISRWNARCGGSSAFVPPAIAHDLAGGASKAVETQTAGLGPDGPTPEAVSAEATCGATLSEDILIGCGRTNRSCSPKTDNLRLGILDQTSSQREFGMTLHGGRALSDS